jgi:hypothetical protein
MAYNINSKEELYYDEDEFLYGDGFYPSLNKSKTNYKIAIIEFIFIDKLNYWIQLDGICISGLDCDNGINLLNNLNKKNNSRGFSIYNKYGNLIYPKLI